VAFGSSLEPARAPGLVGGVGSVRPEVREVSHVLGATPAQMAGLTRNLMEGLREGIGTSGAAFLSGAREALDLELEKWELALLSNGRRGRTITASQSNATR
jgi:hypothetical protein